MSIEKTTKIMNGRSMKPMISLAMLGICLLSGSMRVQANHRGPHPQFLSPLFGSHMVFPRDVKAPIWGWSKPGSKITAGMQGKTAETTTGKDGKWILRLGPFPAGGPHVLTITGSGKTVILKNVLIGDVWFCSGQSNMNMGINRIDDAENEIANANHPQLRLFESWQWNKNKWRVCSPQSVSDAGPSIKRLPNGKLLRHGFSAVAYFFGRDLQKTLNIPIGLVHASAGGTFIEMWSSLKVLQPLVKREDVRLTAWFKHNDAAGSGWSAAEYDHNAWKTITFPHLDPKKIPKHYGIVWFRKEIDLPAEWAGEDLLLSGGWIGSVANIWINGKFVANTSPVVSCKIPARLLKSGKNTLALRFLNRKDSFGFRIKKAKDLRIDLLKGKGSISLAGKWHYRTGSLKSRFKSAPPHFWCAIQKLRQAEVLSLNI